MPVKLAQYSAECIMLNVIKYQTIPIANLRYLQGRADPEHGMWGHEMDKREVHQKLHITTTSIFFFIQLILLPFIHHLTTYPRKSIYHGFESIQQCHSSGMA
jgi:hypothetical protein